MLIIDLWLEHDPSQANDDDDDIKSQSIKKGLITCTGNWGKIKNMPMGVSFGEMHT